MEVADVGALMLAVNRFSTRQAAIVAALRNQLDESLAQLRNDLQPLVIGDDEPEAVYQVGLFTDDMPNQRARTEIHASNTIALLNAAERWARTQRIGEHSGAQLICWVTGPDLDVRFLIGNGQRAGEVVKARVIYRKETASRPSLERRSSRLEGRRFFCSFCFHVRLPAREAFTSKCCGKCRVRTDSLECVDPLVSIQAPRRLRQ